MAVPGEDVDYEVIFSGVVGSGESVGYAADWTVPTAHGWYTLRAVFRLAGQEEQPVGANVTIQVR